MLLLPGCGGGETTGTTGGGGTSTTGGAGGTGGASTTGGTTTGGTGGTGGASDPCLPASAHAAFFTIVAPDLCAVAVFTSDGSIAYQQPTWGEHGGPLLVTAGPADGQVTLERWSPPDGADGAIAIAKTTVDANIPAGAFAGAEAIDLGFRPGTAISYSGAFPDTLGELVIADGASTDERYPVNGLFSMTVVPAAEGGRIVYSGLSPLGTDAAGPNGLYAADDCSGDFVPMNMPACTDPIQVHAWGDASGPAVTDSAGNVFAVMTNFAGDQVARAFSAAAIAKGAAPNEGDVFFGIAGFGLGLAAIAPTESAAGIVAFQPSDAMSFEALDVLEVRYAIENGVVTAQAPPKALLSLTTANTALALLTDPTDRLWVGAPDADGITFVVLARKP